MQSMLHCKKRTAAITDAIRVVHCGRTGVVGTAIAAVTASTYWRRTGTWERTAFDADVIAGIVAVVAVIVLIVDTITAIVNGIALVAVSNASATAAATTVGVIDGFDVGDGQQRWRRGHVLSSIVTIINVVVTTAPSIVHDTIDTVIAVLSTAIVAMHAIALIAA